MMHMRDATTGQPVCRRCHRSHDDRRRNYCAPCADLVLREFGVSHSLRTPLAGDPDRPVRRMEGVR